MHKTFDLRGRKKKSQFKLRESQLLSVRSFLMDSHFFYIFIISMSSSVAYSVVGISILAILG